MKVKKFFRNLFILIFIIVILDRGLGLVIKHFFYLEERGDSSVTTYALRNCKEDILIFGSSRANHHYVPQVFADSLGMSVYNFGRDGMDIRYSDIILKSVVSRYQPKIIILDVNPYELFKDDPKDHKIPILVSALLPYASDFPEVRRELKKLNSREVLKSDISMLYRYNSLPASILQHLLKIGPKLLNGYDPLYTTMKPGIPKPKVGVRVQIDPQKVEILKNFIEICQSNKIQLVIAISPVRYPFQFDTVQLTKQIASEFNLEVWDYYNSPTFNKTAYFADIPHLNNEGALYYSKLIAHRFKDTFIPNIRIR